VVNLVVVSYSMLTVLLISISLLLTIQCMGSESLDRRSNPLEQLPHWVVTSLFAAVGGIFLKIGITRTIDPMRLTCGSKDLGGFSGGRGGEKEG